MDMIWYPNPNNQLKAGKVKQKLDAVTGQDPSSQKKHREMLSIMYLHMGYYAVDDVHVFLYADCASMTCSK